MQRHFNQAIVCRRCVHREGRVYNTRTSFTVFFQRLSTQDKKVSTVPTLSAKKGRSVVMLGQDIIHAATNSQMKTPKHIGLAFTIHHLTGSKEVMTLLNRMGHCSSYDDVEIVNTAWEREMEASNITPAHLSNSLPTMMTSTRKL